MKLWHPDDPALPTSLNEVRPDRDAPGTHPASTPGETQEMRHCVPASQPYKGRRTPDALGSPDQNVVQLHLNGEPRSSTPPACQASKGTGTVTDAAG